MRSVRSLLSETVRHGRAWLEIAAHSKHGASNFGDECSALLMREFTGQRVVWAPLRNADVVSVGSVLNAYAAVKSEALVLGSGIREPAEMSGHIQIDRVLAVRGRLTQKHLSLEDEVTLGDPGLAISRLVGPSSARGMTDLLIPHFGVLNSARGRSAIQRGRAAGLRIALPNLSPLAIAREISKSRSVVTSSLHAVIFAHSLGIPVHLVSFSDGVHSEPDFKYRDYMSIFGIEPHVVPFDVLVESKSAFDQSRSRAEDEITAVLGQVEPVVDRLVQAYGKL